MVAGDVAFSVGELAGDERNGCRERLGCLAESMNIILPAVAEIGLQRKKERKPQVQYLAAVAGPYLRSFRQQRTASVRGAKTIFWGRYVSRVANDSGHRD